MVFVFWEIKDGCAFDVGGEIVLSPPMNEFGFSGEFPYDLLSCQCVYMLAPTEFEAERKA